MKLIDIEKVLSELCLSHKDIIYIDKNETAERIRKIPSIDIEPKRGEWIDMGDFEQCSVCKGTHLKEFQSYYGKTTWIKTPYCPNCGADMRKESE